MASCFISFHDVYLPRMFEQETMNGMSYLKMKNVAEMVTAVPNDLWLPGVYS
jgi:hypothetical protein